jgi:hypothetical protein
MNCKQKATAHVTKLKSKKIQCAFSYWPTIYFQIKFLYLLKSFRSLKTGTLNQLLETTMMFFILFHVAQYISHLIITLK